MDENKEKLNENFLPIVHGDTYKSSAIDVALASKMTKDDLVRFAAVEKTIEFLSNRGIVGFKTFDEVFEGIYKKLTNQSTNEN